MLIFIFNKTNIWFIKKNIYLKKLYNYKNLTYNMVGENF